MQIPFHQLVTTELIYERTDRTNYCSRRAGYDGGADGPDRRQPVRAKSNGPRAETDSAGAGDAEELHGRAADDSDNS